MSQQKTDDDKSAQLRPPTIVISMQSSANKKDKNDENENTKKIKHTPPSSRITLNRNYSVPLSRSSASLRSMATPRNGTHRKQERFFYRPIKVLGKGAFGVVYCSKGRDGELVAIKKVQLNPHYKNRELDILRQLNHTNCIRLLDEFTTNETYTTSSVLALSQQGHKDSDSFSGKKNELSIVMDYLPSNLHQFSLKYHKSQKQTPLIYTKLFSYQLFTGLRYLHNTLKITHRDIKPENILIDNETGILKICDFGSAKELVPGEKSVSYIASRYYRAPELIMGCEFYTTAIDIWAAGCVIAEILTCGVPIFAARESSKQLEEIAAIIGPPKNKDLNAFQHPPVNFKIEPSNETKSSQPSSKRRAKLTVTSSANTTLPFSSTNSSTMSMKPTSIKSNRPKLSVNHVEPTKEKQRASDTSSISKHSLEHGNSMMPSTSSPRFIRKKPEQTLVQITTLEKSLPSDTPPELVDLLKSIFVYNPTKRPTAEQCMRHPFFADLFTEKLHLPNGYRLPDLEEIPQDPPPSKLHP